MVTEFFSPPKKIAAAIKTKQSNKYPKPGHLMTVNTQAERASGVMNAIRNFARFPNVVGTHWFQYCDEPLGGREDGEDYNMGLIDLANRPYEEVTEVFRTWNPKLTEIHRDCNKRYDTESAPQHQTHRYASLSTGSPYERSANSSRQPCSLSLHIPLATARRQQ